MDRNLARCRFAYRDIAKWTGGLRRASERRYRSEAQLLLLLGGDLALRRRLLLRGGLRLRCLLHHVALLVRAKWRFGFSTCANRRHCIFDYYSAKKKNIFHVKETCVQRRRMRLMTGSSARTAAGDRARRRQRRRLSAFFLRIQDVPVKRPLPACEDAAFEDACRPLDSVCALRGGHILERWNSGFPLQKNF
jgi:hypothetical protein